MSKGGSHDVDHVVTVWYDAGLTNPATLAAEIRKLGYEVEVVASAFIFSLISLRVLLVNPLARVI